MNTRARETSVVTWPTPPFFRLDKAPQPGDSRECALKLTDDRVMSGELVDFEAGADSIGLRQPAAQEITRIDLATIRSIKLIRPTAYVAHTEALDAVGASAQRVDTQKPFVLSLRDGSQITGKTLGFVKQKEGMFLFLVEGKSSQVTHCFVPAGQISDIQIGPLLGDTLVEKQVVTADALAAALKKQTKLREERMATT